MNVKTVSSWCFVIQQQKTNTQDVEIGLGEKESDERELGPLQK